MQVTERVDLLGLVLNYRNMKVFLFDLLPTWLKNYKHADKIVHVVYGVIIYICLAFALPNHLALFVTYIIAMGIEVKDSITHRGDYFDFLAKVIIPTIIYIYELHF